MMIENLMVAVFAAFVPCVALSTRSSDKSATGANDRPVSRIVKLLKKVQAELEEDVEADEKVYDKVKCWCETNDKERTKSITEAEAHIEDLFSTVKEAASKSGQLKAEIKHLQDQVADMRASLTKASEIREQEMSRFTGEEKETLQTVSALKSAITAIQRQHTAIAQGRGPDPRTAQGDIKKVVSMLRLNMQTHGRILLANTKPHERRILKAFMQSPENDNFQEQDLGLIGFAPKSGSILGILQGMLKTFEENLSEAGHAEMSDREEYEKMKTSKEQEIASCEKRIANKQEELADYDETSAQGNEDLVDTRAARSADTSFLYDLHLHCQMTDHEWGLRSKVWQDMIQGVGKTIAALSNDKAKDTFTDAFHSGSANLFQSAFHSNAIVLFQMRSLTVLSRDGKRAQAANVLTEAGRRIHSPVLLKISSSVQLDAFSKVKAAIDAMITQLVKQAQDEVKRKNFCNEGLHDNDLQTLSAVRDKRDVNAKLTDVNSKIETLDSEIEQLKAEIAKLEEIKKRAADFRELEKNFHRIITNQRKAQKVLNKALDLLNGNAEGHQEAFSGFLQQPQGFDAQKQHGGHEPIVALLEHIIKNSKDMETATRRAEEEAKKGYMEVVKKTQGAIDEKSTGMINKSEDRAKYTEERTAFEEMENEVTSNMERLGFDKADLHESCDFVLRNFDIRQEARSQEVDALRKANAILSGSNFESFLEELQ